MNMLFRVRVLRLSAIHERQTTMGERSMMQLRMTLYLTSYCRPLVPGKRPFGTVEIRPLLTEPWYTSYADQNSGEDVT
jgi:hypothetical protein